MYLKICFAFILILIFFSLYSCNKSNQVWIAGWEKTASMNTARAGGAVVVHNDVIYMIGGVDGKNFLSSIESARIQKDGSLSPWEVTSELPEQRGFMSAVVHENRIYVVGGANGEYGKNLLNTVVSAEVFDNGKIGSWREEKQKLMLPRRCSKLIKNGDQLLALGGFGGTLLDSVEVSYFSKDGELSPWQLNNAKLTMPRYVNSVSRVGDKAFVLGGHHPRKGVGLSEVEYADLNANPITWHKTNAMASGRYAFSSFSYQGNLYTAGGISGSEYLNSIEKARIKFGDSEISWQKSIDLPLSMANFTTIVVKEWVYLLGGSTRHNYLNSAWRSSINENGSLGYWGSKGEEKALQTKDTEKSEKGNLVNKGTVIKNINTEGYTYLLVEEKNEQVWLAAPKMDVQNNTHIQYSEGVYMSNFFSKSLNKKFDSIIFVGTVRVSK